MAFTHQFQQLALAGHHITEIQAGKLVLVRQGFCQLAQFNQTSQDPVVERTLVFEFKGADTVRDAFKGIFDRVGPGVHRVNAPGIAGAVVVGMTDAVQHGVAHIHVG